MNAARPNAAHATPATGTGPALPTSVRRVVEQTWATLAEAEALVRQIVSVAFARSACPRSVEYRDGVTQFLLHRALGRRLLCSHPPGTAQADAWFAGLEEGKTLWRMQVQSELQRKRAGARS